MSRDCLPSANPRYPGQSFLSYFLPLAWNIIPKKRATCLCLPINKIFQHLKLHCGNEHTHFFAHSCLLSAVNWSSVSMRENPPGKPRAAPAALTISLHCGYQVPIQKHIHVGQVGGRATIHHNFIEDLPWHQTLPQPAAAALAMK